MRAVCSQLAPENKPVSMFGWVGVAVGVWGGIGEAVGRYGLKVGVDVGFVVHVGCGVDKAGVGFPIVSVFAALQSLVPTGVVSEPVKQFPE